jgi:hypothetical protein
MSDRRIPFTPEDEDRIAGASIWGIIAAVASLISTLGSAVSLSLTVVRFGLAGPLIPVLVGQTIGVVIGVALSIWLIQACLSFRAVARTDVADKAFLLRGFDHLHKYFMTIGILMILAIIGGVVLVVLRLVLGTMRGLPF